MKDYKIEKDIPITKLKQGQYESLTKEMGIGDSILTETRKEGYSIQQSINRNGYKGAMRKTREGFRVWRIK